MPHKVGCKACVAAVTAKRIGPTPARARTRDCARLHGLCRATLEQLPGNSRPRPRPAPVTKATEPASFIRFPSSWSARR